MAVDTNLIIKHVRLLERLPGQAIIPMVVAGELEAFALKADWGYQKITLLQTILDYYPLIEIHSVEVINRQLYDICIKAVDGKVKNLGSYTANVFGLETTKEKHK